MQLLYPLTSLVQESVYGRSCNQDSSDYPADPDKEAGETRGARFPVDDFHGGDIVREKDAGNTTTSVQFQLVVIIFLVSTSIEAPLVACYAVLMRLDAAGLSSPVASKIDRLMWNVEDRFLRLPAEGQVGS